MMVGLPAGGQLHSCSQNATDFSVNGTMTALSQKRNAGLALYTTHRQRSAYDHNNDNFLEMPSVTNNSFGLNSFFNLDKKLIVGLPWKDFTHS